MAFEELLIKAADELESAEAWQNAKTVLVLSLRDALEEFDTGIRPT